MWGAVGSMRSRAKPGHVPKAGQGRPQQLPPSVVLRVCITRAHSCLDAGGRGEAFWLRQHWLASQSPLLSSCPSADLPHTPQWHKIPKNRKKNTAAKPPPPQHCCALRAHAHITHTHAGACGPAGEGWLESRASPAGPHCSLRLALRVALFLCVGHKREKLKTIIFVLWFMLLENKQAR